MYGKIAVVVLLVAAVGLDAAGVGKSSSPVKCARKTEKYLGELAANLGKDFQELYPMEVLNLSTRLDGATIEEIQKMRPPAESCISAFRIANLVYQDVGCVPSAYIHEKMANLKLFSMQFNATIVCDSNVDHAYRREVTEVCLKDLRGQLQSIELPTHLKDKAERWGKIIHLSNSEVREDLFEDASAMVEPCQTLKSNYGFQLGCLLDMDYIDELNIDRELVDEAELKLQALTRSKALCSHFEWADL